MSAKPDLGRFASSGMRVTPDDATAIEALGPKTLELYLGLSNYLNNWKRLGFTDEDITRPGSDRLVDALIVYGTPETIAGRLKEHLDAGADHVPIQLLTSPAKVVGTLAELAGPLGLD